MIFTVSILFGMVEYQETSNGVRVTFVNDSTDLKQNNLEQIIALPSKSINIRVNSCEIAEYTNDGELLRTSTENGEEFIELQRSFVMRNLYAHQLVISKTKKTDEISMKSMSLSCN